MTRPRLIRTLLALLALAALLAGPGINPDRSFLERPEQQLYDWRMRLNQQAEADPRVVIVDIDEASLSAEGRWPWPREKLAALLDRLFDDYAIGLLACDVLFAESDRLLGLERVQQAMANDYPQLLAPVTQLMTRLDPDRRLAASFSDRPVVLGYAFANQQRYRSGQLPAPLTEQRPAQLIDAIRNAPGYSANLALLQQQAMGGGFFDNPLIDSDGIYRRVPLLQRFDGQLYPSLSLAVMATLLGSEQITLGSGGDQGMLEQLSLDGLTIPVDAQGAAMVPYRGPQGSFPYLSATEVLHGRADPARLEGTIVLLGTSAAGLLDLRATPVQNAYPGVEVHANLIAGMLDERLLHRPDYMRGANFLQCLLVGLLMVLLPPLVGAIRATLLTLLLGTLIVAGNLYLWRVAGHVLPLAPPLLVLLALFSLQQLLGYVFETRQRQQLSGLFGQYVPPALVDELQQQASDLALGGDSRDMTVLFADIRGFTAISERLSPPQLSRLMDIYLSPMTEEIHAHRGTIDKYMGDAIMAFWGAPLRDPSHGRNALQAALAMLRRLALVNRQLAAADLPLLRIGIGLNSGEMSVGNMGSRFRMAYTVLGDAVNLGSRLEGLTKLYGVALIVSAGVAAANPELHFRQLDRVRVKGKQQPVAIYEPLDPAQHDARLPAIALALQQHQQMLDAYWQRDWPQALQLCQQLASGPLGKPLYALYSERIAGYRQHAQPPGPEWDGVYRLDHK